MNASPLRLPLPLWLSLFCGLLLDIVPLPDFMQPGRPLWLALILSFWVLYLPSWVGFFTAFVLGLFADVLFGTWFGQHALVLLWLVFCLRLAERRLLRSTLWWQSQWLLLIFASAQLIHLWLGVLGGSRPALLSFLLPAFISAVLWPWIFLLLRGLQRRLNLVEN
ncbi:hypothetical protein AXE65_02265 [Ventosimonas gracilis]|uniref:Rod shape-determining protein MreD n=1 Tax=Ventosimonas gracilis TaxID=1680762 RepID=A0A139SV45_9GAMM|nr:rod shape-determining protein MreD [Ventosimonas gracilis]KXU38302.1 hypothetical protein AXE65_02265 [Ventosimonas gracilis]